MQTALKTLTAVLVIAVAGVLIYIYGFLPRQLHTRGDRLAFSNGIIILAAAAALLVVIYDAKVTALIQLYIVGVFVSFTLSQAGMVRHWTRLLAGPLPTDQRPRTQRCSSLNNSACSTHLSRWLRPPRRLMR